MKTLQTTFCVCCFLFWLHPHLQAAPPQGYVIEWGWNTAAGKAAPAKLVLSNTIAISAGRLHCLALKGDGTVVAWSWNRQGDPTFDNTVLTSGEVRSGNKVEIANTTKILTNGVVKIDGQILSDVISIATGDEFGLALKKDRTIVAWGDQERMETVPILTVAEEQKEILESQGMQFDQIDPATGLPVGMNRPPHLVWRPQGGETRTAFSVGLLNDGTVATRVEDHKPIPLSNVVAIAAAGFTSFAVKDDGTVVTWEGEKFGRYRGQLRIVSDVSNVLAVAAGEGYQGPRTLALKKDGAAAHWGSESIYNDATPPAGLSNVVAIAAGDGHTLALKSDGTVIGWGFNEVGQATGLPTKKSPNISSGQVRIGGQVLSNVVSIAAGRGYSMALK